MGIGQNPEAVAVALFRRNGAARAARLSDRRPGIIRITDFIAFSA
jgi:hypothetical protein